MTVLEELAAHLPDELVVVDIGCRWGFAPHWDALGSRVTLIGFDADETEITRLREAFASEPRMQFYARTLGAQPGEVTLIRTHDAAGTTVFRPDRSRLMHLPDYEGARILAESMVEVTTLDDWMEDHGSGRVDALKLDTQGSELEILRGSAKGLASARHVEVEVAFNEMFEEAPLFGEVDSFLRARGFALWRFRDLVHYALRDAPDPRRVTEQLWYQGVPQSIDARGGQLIWCNAHFVRREMYATEAGLGCEMRLRDACLTYALGFYDLAILSLKRLLAEPERPAGVRASAEGMLAEILESSTPDSATAMPPRFGGLAGLLRRARRRLRRSSDQKTD